MVVFGAGFICSIWLAVFLWFKVDLAVGGVVGALFFALIGVVSGTMLWCRTRGFVMEGRIYAWLI